MTDTDDTDDEPIYTNANPSEVPPVTLEGLQQIMRRFTDRMPARAVTVKVNPLYRDVFVGNLREEGFRQVNPSVVSPFVGVQIVTDPDVPYGQHKIVFAGDEAERRRG